MAEQEQYIIKLTNEILTKVFEIAIKAKLKRLEDIHYVVTNDDFEL